MKKQRCFKAPLYLPHRGEKGEAYWRRMLRISLDVDKDELEDIIFNIEI
jgi:hypothetical protein